MCWWVQRPYRIVVSGRIESCRSAVETPCSWEKFHALHEMQWKLFSDRNPPNFERSTPHTTIHETCQKKRNSQAKSCKEHKKVGEEEKIIFMKFHFEASKVFRFIYSPSVDEVGSVFSCAPSGEVSKQEKIKVEKCLAALCLQFEEIMKKDV